MIDYLLKILGKFFRSGEISVIVHQKETTAAVTSEEFLTTKKKLLSPQGDSNVDGESYESELKNISSNKQPRTLTEANQNLDLSGYDYFGSSVPIFSSFLFDSADEGCITNLTNLLESHNLQHVLHSKSSKANEIKFPSFKKSLLYQEEITECEKSNVAYLRVFKEPADDKDTIIRVLNFLYKKI